MDFKRISAGLLVMAAVVMPSTIFAASVTGTAPQITLVGKGAATGQNLSTITNSLNSQISSSYTTAVNKANDVVSKYKGMNDLSTGFGNATAYANRVGTLQGYQDYDLFAVMFGFMVGAQAPALTYAEISNSIDNLTNTGDIYFGAGAAIGGNVGVNLGFLVKGLYGSVKFGYFPPSIANAFFGDDVSVKSTLFGIGANYQLLDGIGFLGGLARWRGLSVGSGLNFTSNTATVLVKLNRVEQSITTVTDNNFGGTGQTVTFDGSVYIDPSVKIGLDNFICTIPLEVSTSVQLLWILNLTAGLGVDLNMGKSNILLSASGNNNLVISTNRSDLVQINSTEGTLVLDGSTKGSPSLARARAMLGLGFNFGPVKLDIPVTYYLASGFDAGVSLGFVW